MVELLRSAAVGIALMAFGPIATSQSLDEIILQYETYNQTGDPEARAKADGDHPKSWSNVTPDYIEARASEAESMLEALSAIEDAPEGPEASILRHLLKAEIQAHTLDTARIPFVGDWGFFAEAPFTAMRTRANTRAKAEAWIARLNDLPRYFEDHIANMQRGIATD